MWLLRVLLPHITLTPQSLSTLHGVQNYSGPGWLVTECPWRGIADDGWHESTLKGTLEHLDCSLVAGSSMGYKLLLLHYFRHNLSSFSICTHWMIYFLKVPPSTDCLRKSPKVSFNLSEICQRVDAGEILQHIHSQRSKGKPELGKIQTNVSLLGRRPREESGSLKRQSKWMCVELTSKSGASLDTAQFTG